MLLIGFGASTMAGTGDSQGGFFKRSEKVLTGQGKPYEFKLHAVGGDTTRNMLARAGNTVAAGTHDLIVMLGCNDLPRKNDSKPHIRTTLQEYERNLSALLRQIRGAHSLFISSFPVDPEKTGVPRDQFKDYMALATALAESNDYQIWDLYHELLDKDLTACWAEDGLHFNDAGHAMIAEGLIKRVQEWR